MLIILGKATDLLQCVLTFLRMFPSTSPSFSLPDYTTECNSASVFPIGWSKSARVALSTSLDCTRDSLPATPLSSVFPSLIFDHPLTPLIVFHCFCCIKLSFSFPVTGLILLHSDTKCPTILQCSQNLGKLEISISCQNSKSSIFTRICSGIGL